MVSPKTTVAMIAVMAFFSVAALALAILAFVDFHLYKDHTHDATEIVDMEEQITNILVGGGEDGGLGVELPEHSHTTEDIDNFEAEVDALIPPVTVDKKLLHMEISTAAIGVGTPSAAHSYTVTSELLRNNSKDTIEIRVDGGSLDPAEMVQGEIVHSGGTTTLIGNCPFIGPGNTSYSMFITLVRTGATQLTWFQRNINHGSTNPYIDSAITGTVDPIDFGMDWTYQYHMQSGSANTTRAQYHLHQVTA